VLDVQDSAFTTAKSPAAAEVKAAWSKAATDALSGKASAREAFPESAQETAQTALDEAWQ